METATTLGSAETKLHGRVQVITLKRVGFDNRVTQQMAEQAAAHLEAARQDRSIAGCVITGHAEVFCTGGDYRGAGGTTQGRLEFARAFNDFAQAMVRLGKPLVGAINGNAHAGGFSLVAACDLAVVAEDATLGLPEAAHGLFPFLALALVKDTFPKKVLFDMVYRARLLSAREALELHVVNEVVPRASVLARAIELAACTSGLNPDIVCLGRDLYYNMRCASPYEALEQSRFALVAALKALEEGDKPS